VNAAALALSAAVHVALVAGAVVRCDAQAMPQREPAQHGNHGDAVLVTLLPSSDTGDGEAYCPKSYRGVGIKRYAGGPIWEVLPGGPGDKAGLRVGDVLIDDPLAPDMFMVGHRVELRVERDGLEFATTVVIARICNEETP